MNTDDWLSIWDEFGFDRERETEVYPCTSSIQLRAALRQWDDHSGNPDETIDEAVGEALMLVTDSNDEQLGYDLHPGVTLADG